MLVSLKCLKEYVDISNISSKEIADKLTFSGVEVETVSKLASGTNLVIGEILECEPHPNSDHLHVLQVNLGSKYGVKQIVCGAPNARKGLKVIVSRVGALLPIGEIKQSVIRGIESNGMCCSLSELGVEHKYLSEYQLNGIEELDADAPVGEEDVLGYLGLDDEVLNLKVLANRPDLLSIYNVAKEVGAIFSRKVNIPTYGNRVDFNTSLKVGSATLRCLQFAGKEIRDIKIKPSPKWLSSYLMAMGIRSINNIVDIGNYVMLLTGQPLHMYDADKLEKAELIVKDDIETSFVALDEKTYNIKRGDIVITSDNKVMCLGGVMGALSCAVDEKTKNIYIESASFDSASIRRTSTRLGLASESSSRFVKGTYHHQYEDVINLATHLIFELCEASKASEIKSYLNEEEKTNVINTSVSYINARLGTSFDKQEIISTLSRLDFIVKSSNEDELEVIVPKHRLDISCDADISEEVIRMLGYDKVNAVLPTLDVTLGGLTNRQKRLKNIREYLLDIGLDECLTYSLLKRNEVDLFNFLGNEEKYGILNPLTDEHEVLRTYILHSLLKVAEYNVSRQNKNLALFETSNMISKSSNKEHLSIVLVGNRSYQGLIKSEPYDFYDMKGIIEGIFSLFGVEKSRYKIDAIDKNIKELHPGKSACIVFQNTVIGYFGELHPNMYENYSLGKTHAVVLEMNLEPLLEAKVSEIKSLPINKFPVVFRDIALIVNKDVKVGEIIKTIKMTGRGIVNNAEVFDVYLGENIANNKKSIAITITYSSDNHTLSDKEVSDIEEKIKFELSKIYHAEYRI